MTSVWPSRVSRGIRRDGSARQRNMELLRLTSEWRRPPGSLVLLLGGRIGHFGERVELLWEMIERVSTVSQPNAGDRVAYEERHCGAPRHRELVPPVIRRSSTPWAFRRPWCI